ncbi:band 4.1-like protein 3 isoform X6 [Oryzias latipes]|uniref:band 4.1-like protein 3 isoform X6 n=1 Tax=Oryzias latipes TaxID=8090 RepID=UPI0009DAC720|nr:band 4.1-like protein 3 isoform X6 [Oryzias latipes]
MTTESGSESKQPQENREAEKSKAAEEQTSPQNQPEKFPAAAGHSTPAKREQEQQREDQVSHRSSSSRLSKSPLRGVRKVKIMQCKVALLDGSDYTVDVEKRAKGQILFSKICEHLNLLEKDYFGITYRDIENQKNWLDPSKELKKQIRSKESNGPWNFAFNVKFYPPDPSQLSEDITRYYLCLQLRDDVVSGRLPCSFATHTVLGSYTVQSELGDYDPEEMASDYVSELRLAPNQTKELEEKVMELHKTYKGMTPAEAEMHFLENAKKLSMYGVDLHHAKLVGSLSECLALDEEEDSEGVEIMLGVCASGLLIYRDKLRINRFAWPKILKISYKRNNFYIKIRPGEFEQFESTIGFKLPNHRAAKRLWKVCVEHHTFFRLVSPEAPQKKFLSLGSKFRYSGRTQAQTRRASSQIIRPAPFFERTSSKRYNMSRSLDGATIAENHDTLMKDSTAGGDTKAAAIITTVTTEREEKTEQEDAQKNSTDTHEAGATSQEPKQTDSERTDFAFDGDITVTESEADEESETQTQYSFIRRVKGENVFIRHSNLMLEDTEPLPEVAKHQTNISELKRSFLETAGSSTPGPTEWEKRLSSSPLRSPRSDEAPMIEPLEPQDTKDDQQSGAERKEEVGPKGTEAAGYLVKVVPDSVVTEGVTSSGPHGISLSTTMDDDVFLDGTLREEVEEKTPDSQEEVSETSVLRLSPGAVRQEVSQAITDKKGTLIILKEAEDQADSEGGVMSALVDEEEEAVGPEELEADKNQRFLLCKEAEIAPEDIFTHNAVVKLLSLTEEMKGGDMNHVRGLDSPKKAMASWISEEVKTEASEVISARLKSSPTRMTVSESSAMPLVVSTPGRVSSPQQGPPGQEKTAVATETGAAPGKTAGQMPLDSVEAATKDVPVIHTETKTITYEAAADADTNGDADPGVLLSAQTITSETTSTTTTTHITKTVKGGISETRIEKRIVITGDADIDHDEALAQAIKEAKEQHPDMSVTKVVVHKETEITPEGED